MLPLKVMLAADPDPFIKSSATDSLGLLGVAGARPQIEKLLSSTNSFHRSVSARALGLLGVGDALPDLLMLLDPRKEPDGVVRGSTATALGQLGDPAAVEPLVRSLDPSFEKDGINRASAATALGQLGDRAAVEPLIGSLDLSFEQRGEARGSAATALGQLGDPAAVEPLIRSLDLRFEKDGINRASAATAKRRLTLIRAAPRKGGIDLSAEEEAGVQRLWSLLKAQFYELTGAPGPSSFPLLIGRALEVMEDRFGGGEARGWKEKDYQRGLAGLLQMAGERFRVLTEAEPADRSRLDIYIEDVGGSARALLELKLDGLDEVEKHTRQLLRYRDELRTRGTHVEPHLILLDRSARPEWAPGERRRQEGEITVWLAHVNRQPPSAG